MTHPPAYVAKLASLAKRMTADDESCAKVLAWLLRFEPSDLGWKLQAIPASLVLMSSAARATQGALVPRTSVVAERFFASADRLLETAVDAA